MIGFLLQCLTLCHGCHANRCYTVNEKKIRQYGGKELVIDNCGVKNIMVHMTATSCCNSILKHKNQERMDILHMCTLWCLTYLITSFPFAHLIISKELNLDFFCISKHVLFILAEKEKKVLEVETGFFAYIFPFIQALEGQ